MGKYTLLAGEAPTISFFETVALGRITRLIAVGFSVVILGNVPVVNVVYFARL